MKPVLTSENLLGEYVEWCKHFGNRNDSDQRFGQFIHNNYHLVPDVAWNTENANEAYVEIYEKLQEYQR